MTAATTFAYAAPTAIKIDFSTGMPENVNLYDLDGNIPSPDLPKGAFTEGTAWTAYDFGGNDGRVACSTSWYVPSGKSDDWMVLPEIEIRKGAELRWRSRSFDRNLPDGYSIYISDSGSHPTDFKKTEPFFSTDSENPEWTDHMLSLDDYDGRTVSIAFVNDSEDCNMLLISDIFAGLPEMLSFSLDGRCMGRPGDIVPLRFNVTTDKSSELKGLSAGYTYGERTGEFSFPETVVTPGETLLLELPDDGITLREGKPEGLTIWMEHDGERVEKTLYPGVYPRRMVAEEATGTWCMWCVGGIVMMEHMKATYPDNFIGIAVHGGSDPMTLDNYSINGTGYPRVSVNREIFNLSPSEVEPYIESYIDAVPEAVVNGQYEINDGKVSLTAKTIAAQAHNNSDYNIAVVVTENDVHVPGDRDYNQKNAYAGGENGPMGGFEDKPAVISSDDMWYQDVARCILSDRRGVQGSVPAQLKPGEPTVFNYTFDIPENVIDEKNIEVILLILDKKSQKIVNGSFAEKKPVTGIWETEADMPGNVKAYVRGRILNIAADSPLDNVKVWTPDGKLIADVDASAEPRVQIPLQAKGIVIWQATSAEGVVSGKAM